jgi:hypothetical protein
MKEKLQIAELSAAKLIILAELSTDGNISSFNAISLSINLPMW